MVIVAVRACRAGGVCPPAVRVCGSSSAGAESGRGSGHSEPRVAFL